MCMELHKKGVVCNKQFLTFTKKEFSCLKLKIPSSFIRLNVSWTILYRGSLRKA